MSYAPTLWSQLDELSELAYLKQCLKRNPYQIGHIQAVIREAISFNIYSLNALEWWDSTRIQTLKNKVMNFLGVCMRMVSENAIELAPSTEFFTSLRSEVNALKTDNFRNSMFGLR